MPRRKELRSVAYGICHHFISRYNEIDGYWALGIIYKEVNLQHIYNISFDIYNKHIIPNTIPTTKTLEYFHLYLYTLLDKHGFSKDIINSAKIDIDFNLKPIEIEVLYKNIYGNPFVCTVSLTDDKNKLWSIQMRSSCREHNPNIELQSNYYSI